jgi:hypothetical protein
LKNQMNAALKEFKTRFIQELAAVPEKAAAAK